MIKIAINGFGRIGRPTLKRILKNHPDLDIVAINDLTDPETLAHLLKYDSVYGTYEKEVKGGKDFLLVDGKKIKVFSEPDPENLPWKNLGVDVVIESTGRFTDREGASKHLKAGAKKVIISANSKDADLSLVLGVNHHQYDPLKHHLIANCSCTTNCASPIIKILHENFGVLKAQMLTVHAVTATQSLVDGPKKDLRKSRAAFANIIPAETGAAKAVVRVVPELQGRISGSAFRVPILCGSVLQVVAQVEKETTAEEINKAFKKETEGRLKGLLSVSENYLVSSDIVGTSFSGIVDLSLTEVLDLPEIKDENLIKVVAWYDNEYAYGCRLAELAEYVGKRI